MNRPNLSIPKTKMEVSHEIISVVAILASIVYLWMEWPKLPAIVPIHFNGSGEVDGWGGKGTLFLLPGLAVVVYIGLTILSKYPHAFNYPVEITESNAQRQYVNARMLVSWLKVEIVAIFCFLSWTLVQAAAEKQDHPGIFLYVILGVLIITIIFYIYRTIKLK